MEKQLQIESVIASAARQSLKLNSNIMRLLQSYFLRNDVLKRIVFCFALLFSVKAFAQETKLKKYSFTELFRLIEVETDTIFKLKDAKIVYDSITDKRHERYFFREEFIPRELITVDKQLHFENVFFDKKAGLYNIHFKENVTFKDAGLINFEWNTVDGEFRQGMDSKSFDNHIKNGGLNFVWIRNSIFNNRVDLYFYPNIKKSLVVFFTKNTLNIENTQENFRRNYMASSLSFDNITQLTFSNNTIHLGERPVQLSVENMDWNLFVNNTVTGNSALNLNIKNPDLLVVSKNNFGKYLIFDIEEIKDNYNIDWIDFKSKTISDLSILKNMLASDEDEFENTQENFLERMKNSYNLEEHMTKRRVENLSYYNSEIALKGKFLNHYRALHNTVWANEVYIEIKDLETQRLAFLYHQNPSFKGYFTWKINQFLKVFSAYGTEPARAVIFSMWVILLFAFVYLLFPNSWDAHGRKRIMNRYAFFFKYMNKKSGIHEVYLDHQKEDLLEFDEFKTLVAQQGKTVPKFFTATALPLYKWAISGTKFSASVLKRVDIMKGTWSELPAHKRFWKSVLLIGAFTLAVCYDILIKMLNALMLSINTFTTLGFGEIPIKGLPRYLAIIQGFIGWFMLTIFSVSLISQLLN
ncbi:potassium channel family protein [Flavobacteriaceae bacterium S0862]|nr:potassium channel family protein [Flavobacteriaceae bacterium S0862]